MCEDKNLMRVKFSPDHFRDQESDLSLSLSPSWGLRSRSKRDLSFPKPVVSATLMRARDQRAFCESGVECQPITARAFRGRKQRQHIAFAQDRYGRWGWSRGPSCCSVL